MILWVPPIRRSSKRWPVSNKRFRSIFRPSCALLLFPKIDHREHGHRILHDLLSGSLLLADEDLRLSSATQAKWMRLYQHTSRCPVALQSFLDCNPAYWCFVPQRWNASMTAHFNFLGEPTQHTDEVTRLVRLGVIEDQRVADCLDRVPLPPAAYVFSFQQRQQQRFFFKEWLSRTDPQRPYTSLDLYTFNIIAVRTYRTSIHAFVLLYMYSL
jgi:hypothetical protein